MAYFVFKLVSIISLKFRCPTNLRADVYSYNFIDDKRHLKFLGNSLSPIRYFVQLMYARRTLKHSLFCLPFGDCSDGSDWR
jgi:hypothetical protein